MRNPESATNILCTLRAGQPDLRNRWPLTNKHAPRELEICLPEFFKRCAYHQFRLIEPALPVLGHMQRNRHNQHRSSPKF